MDQTQYLMLVAYVAFFSMLGVVLFFFTKLTVRQLKFEHSTNEMLNILAMTSYYRFKDLVSGSMDQATDAGPKIITYWAGFYLGNDAIYDNSETARSIDKMVSGSEAKFVDYMGGEKLSIKEKYNPSEKVLSRVYPVELDAAFKRIADVSLKNIDLIDRARIIRYMLEVDRQHADLAKDKDFSKIMNPAYYPHYYQYSWHRSPELSNSLKRYLKSLDKINNYCIYNAFFDQFDGEENIHMQLRCFAFSNYKKRLGDNEYFRNGDIVKCINNDVQRFSKFPFVFSAELVYNSKEGIEVKGEDGGTIEINNPDFLNFLVPATFKESIPFFEKYSIKNYALPQEVYNNEIVEFPGTFWANIYMPPSLTLIPDEFYK